MTSAPMPNLSTMPDLSALLSPEELERFGVALAQSEARLAEEEAQIQKIIAEHYAERRLLTQRELLRLVLSGESLLPEACRLSQPGASPLPELPAELIARVEAEESPIEGIKALPAVPECPSAPEPPITPEPSLAPEAPAQVPVEPTNHRGITSEELAFRARVSRSVLVDYHRKGIIVPIPGTGTHWNNPRLYEESAIALVQAEKERRSEQRRKNLSNGAYRSKKLDTSALPGDTYTAKALAAVLGCHTDTIRYYTEIGLLTVREGTGTCPTNPRLFDVPDLAPLVEAIKQRRERRSAIALDNITRARQARTQEVQKRAEAAQKKQDAARRRAEAAQKRAEAARKKVAPKAKTAPRPTTAPPQPLSTLQPPSTPQPPSAPTHAEEVGEESLPHLVPLERATRHPYHWAHALTCASEHLASVNPHLASVNQHLANVSEEEPLAPFELVYKPEEGFQIAPPASEAPEAELLPFALLSPPAVGETANRWTCTITASRKSWIYPMAVHFRAQWQRQQAPKRANP